MPETTLDWSTMSGELLLAGAVTALVGAFYANAAAKNGTPSKDHKPRMDEVTALTITVGVISLLGWLYSISEPGALRRAILEGAPVNQILAYCEQQPSYANRSSCYKTELLGHDNAVELREWLEERSQGTENATAPESVDARPATPRKTPQA